MVFLLPFFSGHAGEIDWFHSQRYFKYKMPHSDEFHKFSLTAPFPEMGFKIYCVHRKPRGKEMVNRTPRTDDTKHRYKIICYKYINLWHHSSLHSLEMRQTFTRLFSTSETQTGRAHLSLGESKVPSGPQLRSVSQQHSFDTETGFRTRIFFLPLSASMFELGQE